MLGLLVTLALLVVLTVPLGLVLALGGPSEGTTIRIYAVALVVDLMVFGGAGIVLIGAALRASRGESFTIPVVTPLGERLFPPRAR